MKKDLVKIYELLLKHFGKQHWWPAKGSGNARKLEICIGAILTQNTNWKNVEKALENLRKNKLLILEKIKKTNAKKIAPLIKSSGYYNQKAIKIKAFLGFLEKYHFEKLSKMETIKLREILLRVHGVGKETADSIALYALKKPIFVIDAYTKRAFSRIMQDETSSLKEYDDWRVFFEDNLPKDEKLFNEYHALIVELGKNFCQKNPKCNECPVRFCHSRNQ
jgi:endonuclease III related protein